MEQPNITLPAGTPIEATSTTLYMMVALYAHSLPLAGLDAARECL